MWEKIVVWEEIVESVRKFPHSCINMHEYVSEYAAENILKRYK